MEANHEWFDWIFFAIVGLPMILGLIQLAMPDWLEPLIRNRQSGSASGDTRNL